MLALGWDELSEGTVRPGGAVVLQVLGQGPAQTVLIDHQQLVEKLPPQGPAHPSQSAFALGLRDGIFTTSFPAPDSTASNASVNWAARSRTKNRNRAACSPRTITRFWTCCRVHAPSGWVGRHAQEMDMTGAHLDDEDTFRRRKLTARSIWKKSHASIVDA